MGSFRPYGNNMRKYVRLFAGFALGLYGLSFGNVALAAVSQVGQGTFTGSGTPTMQLYVDGTDRVIVCSGFSQTANGANNITGIDYDGTYLTKIGEIQQTSGNFLTLWYLLAPAVGTKTITIHPTAGTVWGGCASFSGVEQTALENNYASGASGSVTVYTLGLDIQAESRIVGNFSTRTTCGTVTPNGVSSLIHDYAQGSVLWSSSAATTTENFSIGGTCGSNDYFAGIVTELQAVITESGTTTTSSTYSTTFENLILDIGQTLVLGISLCTFGLFSWGAYRIACKSEQYVT